MDPHFVSPPFEVLLKPRSGCCSSTNILSCVQQQIFMGCAVRKQSCIVDVVLSQMCMACRL